MQWTTRRSRGPYLGAFADSASVAGAGHKPRPQILKRRPPTLAKGDARNARAVRSPAPTQTPRSRHAAQPDPRPETCDLSFLRLGTTLGAHGSQFGAFAESATVTGNNQTLNPTSTIVSLATDDATSGWLASRHLRTQRERGGQHAQTRSHPKWRQFLLSRGRRWSA